MAVDSSTVGDVLVNSSVGFSCVVTFGVVFTVVAVK